VTHTKNEGVLVNCPYIDDYFLLFQDYILSEKEIDDCVAVIQSKYSHFFDISILVRWDFDFNSASVFCYKMNSKVRLAYSENTSSFKSKKNQGFDNFFTHVIDDYEIEHEVIKGLKMLHYIGVEQTSDYLEVWPSEDDFKSIASLVNTTVNYLVIAIGASSSERMLSTSSWIKVIQYIEDIWCYKIFIVGGEDVALGAQEISAITSATNLAGKLSFNQSCALIKNAFCLICLDSSMKHVGAALKKSIIEVVAHSPKINESNHHSVKRFGAWNTPCLVCHPLFQTPPCNTECISHQNHCINNIDIDLIQKALQNLIQLQNLSPAL
jgi:ADP-heptose:LPS heptosyltransferase